MMQRDIEAVNESIKHWNRMIAWVRTQPEGDLVYDRAMRGAIGESWYGSDCPLCALYGRCVDCPLAMADRPCNARGSAWRTVEDSTIWREWIAAALRMIDVLQVIAKELAR